MTPAIYLQQVLARYDVDRVYPFYVTTQIVVPLQRAVEAAFPGMLNAVTLSGSRAKGTAVVGSTDVDLFLSFRTDAMPLRDLYEEVFALAERSGWKPKRQNVSVGIMYAGRPVDLVPARLQPSGDGYHSLYRRKARTWTQTNVGIHIARVRESGHADVIKLAKVWRNQQRLEFPSFYLELSVLEALRRRPAYDLGIKFWNVREYLASDFPTVRVLDPANTNNAISDDLTAAERQAVSAAAARSLQPATLDQVIA